MFDNHRNIVKVLFTSSLVIFLLGIAVLITWPTKYDLLPILAIIIGLPGLLRTSYEIAQVPLSWYWPEPIDLPPELRTEGFRSLTSDDFYKEPTRGFEEALRSGIEPHEIPEYTIEQTIKINGDTYSPAEVVDYLEQKQYQEDLLVLGRIGSGKSTFCQAVLREWYHREQGSILWRSSDRADGGFKSTELLKDVLEQRDEELLVVVEDAVREGNDSIFEVIEEFDSDESVTFLLDGRTGEVPDFPPDITTGYISHLDVEDCDRMRELFQTKADDFNITLEGEALLNRVKTDSRAGELLHLVYLFLGAESDVEPGDGLLEDIHSRYSTLQDPSRVGSSKPNLDKYDPYLLKHMGLLINLLNAAPDLRIREGYLYALGVHLLDDEGEQSIRRRNQRVDSLLDELDGWLVFREANEPNGGELRSFHAFWSFQYLRNVVDSESADTAQERTAVCLQAVLDLLGGDLDGSAREGIWSRTSDDALWKEDSKRPTLADHLVEKVFEIGVQFPFLAPLFGTHANTNLQLQNVDLVSSNTTGRTSVLRAKMYHKRGELQTAYEELQWCTDVIEEVDTQSGRDQLSLKRRLELGSVLTDKGDLQAAHDAFEASRELAEKLEQPRLEARALLGLSKVAIVKGDFELAREHLKQGEFSESIREEIKRLIQLSALSGRLGAPPEAMEYAEEALELAEKHGFREGKAMSLQNLGTAEAILGEYKSQNDEESPDPHFENADQYLHQAINLFKELGMKESEAECLVSLGNSYSNQGEFDRAEDYYRESTDIYTNYIGNRRGIARTNSNIAVLYERRAQSKLSNEDIEEIDSFEISAHLEEAEQIHEENQDIFRELGDQRNLAATLQNLGDVLFLRRRLAPSNSKENHLMKPRQLYRESFELFSEIEIPHRMIGLKKNLAEIEFELGEFGFAKELCEEAFALIDEYDSTLVEIRAIEVKELYEKIETELQNE